MVLFPQHSEQRMVSNRVLELGAGINLKRNNIKQIKNSVLEVISNEKYKENAMKLSRAFHNAGGAKKSCEVILNIIDNSCNSFNRS